MTDGTQKCRVQGCSSQATPDSDLCFKHISNGFQPSAPVGGERTKGAQRTAEGGLDTRRAPSPLASGDSAASARSNADEVLLAMPHSVSPVPPSSEPPRSSEGERTPAERALAKLGWTTRITTNPDPTQALHHYAFRADEVEAIRAALSGPRVAPEAGASEQTLFCVWCGANIPYTADAGQQDVALKVLRDHSATCLEHPAVKALAALPVEREPSKAEAWMCVHKTDPNWQPIVTIGAMDPREVHDSGPRFEYFPLYRHPAPVGSGEVTDEMVERAASAMAKRYAAKMGSAKFSHQEMDNITESYRGEAGNILRAALTGADQ